MSKKPGRPSITVWSKPLQSHELLVGAVLECDQGLGIVPALGRADFDEQDVHDGEV